MWPGERLPTGQRITADHRHSRITSVVLVALDPDLSHAQRRRDRVRLAFKQIGVRAVGKAHPQEIPREALADLYRPGDAVGKRHREIGMAHGEGPLAAQMRTVNDSYEQISRSLPPQRARDQ